MIYFICIIHEKRNVATVNIHSQTRTLFCFFTDGKPHKARELDMITLGNHAPRSYMTWLPVTLKSLPVLYNLQAWRHKRWFPKFTVRFRPITKEIASSMYNNITCWVRGGIGVHSFPDTDIDPYQCQQLRTYPSPDPTWTLTYYNLLGQGRGRCAVVLILNIDLTFPRNTRLSTNAT